MAGETILLVDDDRLERLTLEASLKDEGYRVVSAANAFHGLECLHEGGADVVITDLRMPGMDGLTFLKEAKKVCPDTEVVLITAYASVESAVTAMREGAHDYLCKPFRYEELSIRLKRLTEFQAHLREMGNLRRQLEERHHYHNLVGKSAAMQRVFQTIELVAKDICAVLIEGETGTGKELVAKAIHYSGPRKDKPFIEVHCAALSRDVIESELFGHEQGAFTGAVKQHKGRFELADGGSLFLDEVDDIPLDIQVKLLRAIEAKKFERVGGEKSLKVDVRIIAASKSDLSQRVREGRFREDLYYRLRVATVFLPPLRERKEDIPLLAEHFLRRSCASRGIPERRMSREALRVLLGYDWPGNVRQIENTVEQAVLLSPGEEIEAQSLPREIHAESNSETVQLNLAGKEKVNLPEILQQVEKQLTSWALARAGGNQARAAELLGIPRTTFRHRLEK